MFKEPIYIYFAQRTYNMENIHNYLIIHVLKSTDRKNKKKEMNESLYQYIG